MLGRPYREIVSPNWVLSPVTSSTSQPSTKNCIPWDMACASDPAQYQRKEGTSHGPFIRLHTEGAADAGGVSATNGRFSINGRFIMMTR